MMYSAKHSVAQSPYQTMRLSVGGQGNKPQRLSRRDRAVLRLNHAHIAPIEMQRWDGVPFLWHTPQPGPTLADQLMWRQSVSFGLPEVLEIVAPVAAAIDHAHSRGVVHGALHPGAIVQMPEGPVVTGFTGVDHAGARPYAAPETIDGRRLRHGDVYALATIVYQMLTGVLPSDSTAARLPLGVDHVLAQALAHDPRRRYRSAGAFVRALQQAGSRVAIDDARGPRAFLRQHALVLAMALTVIAASILTGVLVSMV